jgi:hypothetical protein
MIWCRIMMWVGVEIDMLMTFPSPGGVPLLACVSHKFLLKICEKCEALAATNF